MQAAASSTLPTAGATSPTAGSGSHGVFHRFFNAFVQRCVLLHRFFLNAS